MEFANNVCSVVMYFLFGAIAAVPYAGEGTPGKVWAVIFLWPLFLFLLLLAGACALVRNGVKVTEDLLKLFKA